MISSYHLDKEVSLVLVEDMILQIASLLSIWLL